MILENAYVKLILGISPFRFASVEMGWFFLSYILRVIINKIQPSRPSVVSREISLFELHTGYFSISLCFSRNGLVFLSYILRVIINKIQPSRPSVVSREISLFELHTGYFSISLCFSRNGLVFLSYILRVIINKIQPSRPNKVSGEISYLNYILDISTFRFASVEMEIICTSKNRVFFSLDSVFLVKLVELLYLLLPL